MSPRHLIKHHLNDQQKWTDTSMASGVYDGQHESADAWMRYHRATGKAMGCETRRRALTRKTRRSVVLSTPSSLSLSLPDAALHRYRLEMRRRHAR